MVDWHSVLIGAATVLVGLGSWEFGKWLRSQDPSMLAPVGRAIGKATIDIRLGKRKVIHANNQEPGQEGHHT